MAMQSIRMSKRRHSRRCKLEEIKLAKASSAENSALRTGWTKQPAAQLRLNPQPVSNLPFPVVSLRTLTVFLFLEQKVDAAKSTGKGWLSWGKSETRASTDDLKRQAKETVDVWNSRFEEAKRKAAEKGEDIKQRMDETEDEFRDRVAKAIQKR